MGKILIKCFKTPMRKYFYDRFLDSVVAVSDDEYNILKKVEKTGDLSNDASLLRFRKNGLLQETNITEIEHPETSDLKLLSEHYILNLILQVTQQCNLRCKYCAYSGNYYNREHSAKRMTFDIAKKALDFYLQKSDRADELCLSFYGGEPLLEFDLIKKCVEYILQRKGDKHVRFPMTTNGTLLTDKVIEFIVKHDFSLMISLDGDKESHDANRTFRTGEGSFDVILDNLKALKAYDERYYTERVAFNCVISTTTDIERIYHFYTESDLFNPQRVQFNYVNTVDIKDETIAKVTEKNRQISNLSYIKMALSVLGKRKWDGLSRTLRSDMADIELLYEQLHRHSFERGKTHHGGPCIPGVRRLFVETDGTFFPCERVSEKDSEMSIGSIKNGFEYDKMNFFLNHGKIIQEECISCWNLRECSYCLNNVSKGNQKLTREVLLKYCEKSKRHTLNLLYRLCILVELGYKGNEDLNVYK